MTNEYIRPNNLKGQLTPPNRVNPNQPDSLLTQEPKVVGDGVSATNDNSDNSSVNGDFNSQLPQEKPKTDEIMKFLRQSTTNEAFFGEHIIKFNNFFIDTRTIFPAQTSEIIQFLSTIPPATYPTLIAATQIFEGYIATQEHNRVTNKASIIINKTFLDLMTDRRGGFTPWGSMYIRTIIQNELDNQLPQQRIVTSWTFQSQTQGISDVMNQMYAEAAGDYYIRFPNDKRFEDLTHQERSDYIREYTRREYGGQPQKIVEKLKDIARNVISTYIQIGFRPDPLRIIDGLDKELFVRDLPSILTFLNEQLKTFLFSEEIGEIKYVATVQDTFVKFSPTYDGTIFGDRNDNDLIVYGFDVEAIFVSTGLGDDTITVDYIGNAIRVDSVGNTTKLDLTTFTIDAGYGDDEVYGGAGNDIIFGGRGGDVLEGREGKDYIKGEKGEDVIKGGGGNDKLLGGDGDDQLTGGIGNDSLRGGEGNDVLFGSNGKDELIGGKGKDQLVSGRGNDKLLGGDGDDYVIGGNGKDELIGGKGKDTLIGGIGSDKLIGGEGNDQLVGGKGNDTLIGGRGVNTYDGGRGYDKIVLAPGSSNILNSFGPDTLVIASKTTTRIYGDLLGPIELNRLNGATYATYEIGKGDGGTVKLRNPQGDTLATIIFPIEIDLKSLENAFSGRIPILPVNTNN